MNKNKLKNVISTHISKYIPVIKSNIDEDKIIKVNITLIPFN